MTAERTDVLADLRDVVRIAKAASIGVTGNQPRIVKAIAAIAAVAELIDAANDLESGMESTTWSSWQSTAHIDPPRSRLIAVLARVRGES